MHPDSSCMDVDDDSYSSVYHHNPPSLSGYRECSLQRPNGTAQYVLQGGIPREVSLPIFQRIFTFYVSGHEKVNMRTMSGVSSQRNSSISPVILGQVCRLWRELAHSSPCLWTSIAVVNPKPQDVTIIAGYLRLSGNLPLSIDVVQGDGDFLSGAMIKIMYHLSSESHRWKHVRLSTFPNLPIQPESAPFLESFVFDPKGDWQMDQIEDLCSRLLSPTLRAITFDGGHSLGLRQVPWKHLRSLSIHFLSESETLLQEILPECTSLESLSITIVDDFNGPYGAEHIVTMPKLRSLVVGEIHDLHHLIGTLRLPALEELVISSGFHGTWGCQTLTELFDRSRITHLRSLSWRERPRECLPYDEFRDAVRPPSPDEDDEDDFYVNEDDGCGTVSTAEQGVEDDMEGSTAEPDQEEVSDENVPMEQLIPFLKHPALVYLEELKLYLPVSDTFLQTLHGPRQPRNRGPMAMGRFSSFRGRQSPIVGPLLLPHLKNLVLADASAEGCSVERLVELARTRMLEALDSRRVCCKLERFEIHRPLEENFGSEFEEELALDLEEIAKEFRGLEVINPVKEDDSTGVLEGTSYTIVAPPNVIRDCSMAHS